MKGVNFEKRSTRDWLVGDYDWCYLCTPSWPYCTKGKKRVPPKFFGRDDWLGIFTSVLMGLQHALAMCGGLITVPFLVGANAAKVSLVLISETLRFLNPAPLK